MLAYFLAKHIYDTFFFIINEHRKGLAYIVCVPMSYDEGMCCFSHNIIFHSVNSLP